MHHQEREHSLPSAGWGRRPQEVNVKTTESSSVVRRQEDLVKVIEKVNVRCCELHVHLTLFWVPYYFEF